MFVAKLFVFLNVFNIIYSLEEGDSCQFDDVEGVCISIYECPYAMHLVDVEEKKPPMCFWKDTTRIVCCPKDDSIRAPGTYKRKRSKNAFIQPESKRRQNEERHDIPQTPEVSEPAGCPALPRPKIRSGVQHLAWSKCLDYQRFTNKCIPIDKENKIFKRVSTCGITAKLYEDQVLGGYRANPMEFPHLATLGFKSIFEREITWDGAGSLISEKFILTAAHIMFKYGEVKYALMGALDKSDVQSGVIYNVLRTIQHVGYTNRTHRNDLALLELNERVMFNEYIRPACLPVPGREIRAERYIAGWGETDDRDEEPNILIMTRVRENVRRCLLKYQRTVYDRRTKICVKGNTESTELFKGDSGGPLMALFSNLKCTYSIEGIASVNPLRDPTDSTAIYININTYLDWIVKNVWPDDYNDWNGDSSSEEYD